jgi:hypothetical protein
MANRENAAALTLAQFDPLFFCLPPAHRRVSPPRRGGAQPVEPPTAGARLPEPLVGPSATAQPGTGWSPRRGQAIVAHWCAQRSRWHTPPASPMDSPLATGPRHPPGSVLTYQLNLLADPLRKRPTRYPTVDRPARTARRSRARGGSCDQPAPRPAVSRPVLLFFS